MQLGRETLYADCFTLLDSVVPAAIGILATSFPPGPAKSRAFACFGAGAPLGNAV